MEIRSLRAALGARKCRRRELCNRQPKRGGPLLFKESLNYWWRKRRVEIDLLLNVFVIGNDSIRGARGKCLWNEHPLSARSVSWRSLTASFSCNVPWRPVNDFSLTLKYYLHCTWIVYERNVWGYLTGVKTYLTLRDLNAHVSSSECLVNGERTNNSIMY